MFIENKYYRWYITICEKAKSENRKKLKRNDPSFVYYESHHIIPKSMGGTEEVLLTAKEHYICHLLLPKMLTGSYKHKMINALIKMTFSKSKGQDRYEASSFAVVRAMIAEKNSEMFRNKPKSEETRNNMKGHSGTWIRTESDRDRMRGNNNPMFGKTGDKNPFFGKTHSEEQKEKWRNDARRRFVGNTVAKGRIWVTNGTLDKMVYSDRIPEGYKPGRVKNRKEI
jgi:hypothetical protein